MHPSCTEPPGPPSRVTGASLPPVQLDCPRARSILGPCGPDGLYWEAHAMNSVQIALFAWLPLVVDDVTLLPLWLALLWWFHDFG